MDNTPAASGPTIYNKTLTLAATEYSQEIHDLGRSTPSIKKIMFRLQVSTHTLQYSYVSGGPYFDLYAGEIYYQDGLHANGIPNIYFKTPDAGAIVDIEVWK